MIDKWLTSWPGQLPLYRKSPTPTARFYQRFKTVCLIVWTWKSIHLSFFNSEIMYEHVITHVTFTLFIMTAAGQDSCHTVHSVSDRTLVGHAYKTTSGKCLITCIIACDDDPNCYSLSYKFPMKTCELSSQTSRSHPNSFLLTPDSVYLDHPKRPGGSCVGDLPCRNKGKCENTPQAPGYMCVCRQHYVGEKCEGKLIARLPSVSY